MNNRHRKTLELIFTDPVPTALDWMEIEALLIAIGATIKKGRGSRVKFDYNGLKVAFHRPHKPKTARAYQIEMARDFLKEAGVTP